MPEVVSVSRLSILVPLDGMTLPGEMTLPEKTRGLVIFVHDTPGSRHRSCNTVVAEALHAVGIGSVLFDLLSESEAGDERVRARFSSDIPSLAGRLVCATRTIVADPRFRHFGIGYCGASVGGTAALVAAAWLGKTVDAVVARAALPDMADSALERVVSPSMLIVAERDAEALWHNQGAAALMKCEHQLAVVGGAADLFVDPKACEEVARITAAWFGRYVQPR